MAKSGRNLPQVGLEWNLWGFQHLLCAKRARARAKWPEIYLIYSTEWLDYKSICVPTLSSAGWCRERIRRDPWDWDKRKCWMRFYYNIPPLSCAEKDFLLFSLPPAPAAAAALLNHKRMIRYVSDLGNCVFRYPSSVARISRRMAHFSKLHQRP